MLNRIICTLGCMAALAGQTAHAEIFLQGEPLGTPGAEVVLSLFAREGTSLITFDINPEYERFERSLGLVSLTATAELFRDGSGLCSGLGCAFFYDKGKSFEQDTLLATFVFWVPGSATPGDVPFDLGIAVDGDHIGLTSRFTVLAAIPEPATWLLILSGLALVARRRYRDMMAV